MKAASQKTQFIKMFKDAGKASFFKMPPPAGTIGSLPHGLFTLNSQKLSLSPENGNCSQSSWKECVPFYWRWRGTNPELRSKVRTLTVLSSSFSHFHSVPTYGHPEAGSLSTPLPSARLLLNFKITTMVTATVAREIMMTPTTTVTTAISATAVATTPGHRVEQDSA